MKTGESLGIETKTRTRRCRIRPPQKSGETVNFETFDAPYLEKLRSGDQETERHFYCYFSGLITLKLRSRLRSRQAIEDVRQETFSRVFVLLRKEGGVRQAERLGALVNSVCNHVLFEQYRSNKRAEPLEDSVAYQLVDGTSDALTGVISTETTESVHEVLEDLSERDRKILRSVFLEERDKDEVCRELGIDRGYMRVLVHRAKESFRQSYRKRSSGDRLYASGSRDL